MNLTLKLKRFINFWKRWRRLVKDVEEGISGGIENPTRLTKKLDGGEVNLTIVRNA